MGKVAQGLLYFQIFLGWLLLPLTGPLYFLVLRLAGYRVHDLKKVRRAFQDQWTAHPGPWIICSNHLTMIDSLILGYGLVSLPSHFLWFWKLPWNLPERTNFYAKNTAVAAMCYLAKCVPVNRGGDRDEMKATLDKCNFLLSLGQTLMIFPEGGRSRTGRVDTEGYSYGVGRFVKEFPNCNTMCIYLRGDGQETFSFYPKRNEHFSIMIETLNLEKTQETGMRAQRFYAEQIIRKLARMEEEYFALRRERHRQSE